MFKINTNILYKKRCACDSRCKTNSLSRCAIIVVISSTTTTLSCVIFMIKTGFEDVGSTTKLHFSLAWVAMSSLYFTHTCVPFTHTHIYDYNVCSRQDASQQSEDCHSCVQFVGLKVYMGASQPWYCYCKCAKIIGCAKEY